MKIRGIAVPSGLVVLFLLFFVTAREERIYAAWKNTNDAVFESYFQVKGYLQKNKPVNVRVLTDMTELRKIENPFASGFFGDVRRRFYELRTNPLTRYGHWLEYDNRPYRLERLNRNRTFFPLPGEGLENWRTLLKTPELLMDAAQKNEVRYFLCYFTGWWQTKRHFEGAGLDLIYNDERFMIFEVPGQ